MSAPTHRPSTAAVKLADLAAQLDQYEAATATRRARTEAFKAVTDAVRGPDTPEPAVATDATRQAEKQRRAKKQLREDERRREGPTSRGPSLRLNLPA